MEIACQTRYQQNTKRCKYTSELKLKLLLFTSASYYLDQILFVKTEIPPVQNFITRWPLIWSKLILFAFPDRSGALFKGNEQGQKIIQDNFWTRCATCWSIYPLK